jgi:hypothetical protein
MNTDERAKKWGQKDKDFNRSRVVAQGAERAVKHTGLEPSKDAKYEGGPCSRRGSQRNKNRNHRAPATLVAAGLPKGNH